MSAAYVSAVIALAIFAVVVITHWIEDSNARIDEMVDAALADQAADFGEPTRAEVEAGWDAWVEEALRISETPIYDATAAHIARHEAEAELTDEGLARWLAWLA